MAINKPLTIARQEFLDAIVGLCNDSSLPYFCMESILKDVLSEVHQASVKQYEMDKDNYEAELNKASGKDINKTRREEEK
ncbi:MAG: hypothetical protein II388_05420 [Clostridia bacterium]|nr:hypothetical protein [Clostridia bacterium]